MSCYRPLNGFRATGKKTERGKAVIQFTPPPGPYEMVTLPCGQCIGCRIDRSQQWALRCVHEASLHEENCFVTLTYSEENLPEYGSLVKKDYQDFLKRLRKRFKGRRIRFFLCGEYGGDGSRPHYHALLFGLEFLDKVYWCKSGPHQVYRSPTLEELWTHGYSWIGEVSWQSAAYVARYCMKKVNGDLAYERYVRDVDPETGELIAVEPEFISMSRRPGIAAEWYEKYSGDCRKDYLTHEGRRVKLPRYYDALRELDDLDGLLAIKAKRREVAAGKRESTRRRMAKEACCRARVNQLKRSI